MLNMFCAGALKAGGGAEPLKLIEGEPDGALKLNPAETYHVLKKNQ